jgi:hypothetical protein
VSRKSDQPAKQNTSRAKAVLEFWEHRMGEKLSNREASEMQANVEGVIALLAQWDRADRNRNAKKP